MSNYLNEEYPKWTVTAEMPLTIVTPKPHDTRLDTLLARATLTPGETIELTMLLKKRWE